MITVYGTPICKDCLAMKIIFEKYNVEYNYINITNNTVDLRAFLKMRDTEPIFQAIKDNNGVGIPLFLKEDKKTFDINEALAWEGKQAVSAEELNRITEECVLLCK